MSASAAVDSPASTIASPMNSRFLRRDLDPHQHPRVRVSDPGRGRPFTTTSTLTGANYRIWSGQPGLAGSTILNDFSAVPADRHRVHRHLSRPGHSHEPAAPVVLFGHEPERGRSDPRHLLARLPDRGTGTTASVFTEPITILGSQTTGNGVGFQGTFVVPNTPGTWNDAAQRLDPREHRTQGLPFEIGYTLGGGPTCFVLDISSRLARARRCSSPTPAASPATPS